MNPRAAARSGSQQCRELTLAPLDSNAPSTGDSEMGNKGKNKQHKGGLDTKIKISPNLLTSETTMVSSCQPGEPKLQERALARRSGRSSKNELWLSAADGAWGIGLLAALNFGFSWEQAFIVLAVCFINVGKLRDLAVCFDDGVWVFCLRIHRCVCQQDIVSVKVAFVAAFCLWLGAGYSLFRSNAVGHGIGMCQIECQIKYYGRPWEDVLRAVARPGGVGVSDRVWLFGLCMIRCLVHPVDFIVDVLTQ